MITHAQAAELGIYRSMLGRLVASGALEHVAYGVYRMRGSGTRRLSGLYAEWLMLAPKIPAWERTHEQGLVSHQSAASCYQIGEFPAYEHEFIVPKLHRTTREHVKRRVRRELGVEGVDWEWVDDMPACRPLRIVADLIADRQDPSLIGGVLAEALNKNLVTNDEIIDAADSWQPYRRAAGSAQELADWLLGPAPEKALAER